MPISLPPQLSVKDDIEQLYPGIFVHNVYLSEDQGADRKAGFFGNVNQQIETVAAQLKDIPELNDGVSPDRRCRAH